MVFEHFVVGMLETNCYLLGDPEAKQAVVIDAGGNSERIVRRIEELDLKLVAILNTHGHFDHVLEAWSLKQRLGGRIYMNPKDKPLLQDRMVGMGAFMGSGSKPLEGEIDLPLQEGDQLIFGSIELNVLETPGHTPGHVSLYYPKANIIFVGDTLFAGSIGRTDFPGGSYEALIQSVREKIFPLPGDTMVYPGHGPETTVERERRNNPFFR